MNLKKQHEIELCLADLVKKWRVYYNNALLDYLAAAHLDKPVELAAIIGRFVSSVAAPFVGKKYPRLMIGQDDLFWSLILRAVKEANTCSEDDLSLAADQIHKLTKEAMGKGG